MSGGCVGLGCVIPCIHVSHSNGLTVTWATVHVTVSVDSWGLIGTHWECIRVYEINCGGFLLWLSLYIYIYFCSCCCCCYSCCFLLLLWSQARKAGQMGSKWLMVNLQDSSEFLCSTLNRDLWSEPRVGKLLQSKFIFLQVAIIII